MNKINKKAIWDDLVDVFWTFCVVGVALFVFGLIFSANETKLKNEVQEKDITIEREEFLINYLRTPVSITAFAEKPDFPSRASGLIRNDWIIFEPKEIESLFENALKENLTIADLTSRIAIDEKYIILLELITKTEPSFKDNGIWVHLDNKRIEINSGKAIGKSSTFEIPAYHSDKVKNIKVECKYYYRDK